MTKPVTHIEISFFKPTGYADSYWVDTEDRGLAIRTVMARYDQIHLSAINYIHANRVGSNRAGARPLLEPIKDSP